MKYTFGDREIDTAGLPQATIEALLSRGLTHYLSNELSSKIGSRIKAHLAGDDGKVSDITTEAMQAFRDHPDNKDHVAKIVADATREHISRLETGTIGQRAAAAPKVDPVTAGVQKLAGEEVRRKLDANNLKLVKKLEGKNLPVAEQFITFANGSRKTFAEMVSTQIELHGAKWRAQVEKELAAEAKAKAKLKIEGEATAESLGL